MIIVVVTLNLIITLFNFYLVFRLWQLKKLLGSISSILISCENYLYAVLFVTPQILQKEQTNIYHLRQRYQIWQLQLQKIRQIMILLSWLYRTWRK